MVAARIFSRVSRSGVARSLIRASSRQENLLTGGPHSRIERPLKFASWEASPLFGNAFLTNSTSQSYGFSSSASNHQKREEVNHSADSDNSTETHNASAKNDGASKVPEQAKDSDSDADIDLSIDDLVKLVAEKEELLKLKHKEVEKMQDKVLRSYAEMENVLDRAKREAENSKKFAIQNFSKSLLDVADNLGRASSVVKESFLKIDSSKDSVGAVPLLKTLLEGVEMTEKQFAEVFRKYGVEKFDPVNEQFDPHRHHAVFQVPDASKPPGTVAAVLKSGYMLHDRVLRPAEVGVTEAVNNETD